MRLRNWPGAIVAISLISLGLCGCAGRSGELREFIIKEWKPYIVQDAVKDEAQVFDDVSFTDPVPAVHADTRDVQDFAHRGF